MTRQVAVLVLTAFSLTNISAALSETFALADGQQVEGDIINITGNTLIIRRDEGGMLPLGRKDIASVGVNTSDQKVIEGKFHDWKAGAYTLQLGERLVTLQDGLVLSIKEMGKSEVQVPAQPETKSVPPATPQLERAPL